MSRLWILIVYKLRYKVLKEKLKFVLSNSTLSRLITLQIESDAMSSQSQSDTEEITSNSAAPVIEDHIEIMKHEIEPKEEQTAEDIFGNDIILPRAKPIGSKERRESKEKSKKELEEEEREKMQYVFDMKVYI